MGALICTGNTEVVEHKYLYHTLVKLAKIFFLPITMKLASLVEIAMLIIYHQGTKENF